MKFDDITKFKTGTPGLADKHHLFYDGSPTSVCGRWMFTGKTYELRPNDPMPFGTDRDDCKSCGKYFLRLRKEK